jgi:lipopolysaccharide transport system ATP-binding protein
MPAIVVKGLGKQYRIAADRGIDTLAEAITVALKASLRGERQPAASSSPRKFWALRDVSFEVAEGERIGIIGRNGAGKSTLLKILSRVTQPTEGEATLRGRVGSLLEVGTGFHSELTGRENIYLNGAVLGMRRKAIERHFDAIVDFAGVAEFIDMPVKRYSSGMAVRLGFAVAAHLEPEILIVDEVLAVGDANFQRKCIGRMEDAAASGRTVLFVSHSMSAIRNLCEKTLYLEAGRAVAFGLTPDVITQYLGEQLYTVEAERFYPDDPAKPAVIRRVALRDDSGRLSRHFGLDSQITLEIDYELKREARDCMVIFAVSRDGTYIYQSHDTDREENLLLGRQAGRYRATIPLPRRLLTAGTYSVYAVISVGHTAQYGHDGKPDAVSFEISEEDQSGLLDLKGYSKIRGNLVITEPPWRTEPIDGARWQAAARDQHHADRG